MKKINKKNFKNALGSFVTGVTVISINSKNKFIGKTVNSFSSLSLDPPLILFSLSDNSSSLLDFFNSRYLGISILANKQKNISLHFSKKNCKWGDTKFFLSKNNIPLIKESLVNLESKVIRKIKGGDHTIFICKILSSNISKSKKPMIYFKNKYIL
tara:strand:+ start:98 stop:565 length:468 start_codon:yes stop_codon:yes gene_type:complete